MTKLTISADAFSTLRELQQVVHDAINDCERDGYSADTVIFADADNISLRIVEYALSDGSKVRDFRFS